MQENKTHPHQLAYTYHKHSRSWNCWGLIFIPYFSFHLTFLLPIIYFIHFCFFFFSIKWKNMLCVLQLRRDQRDRMYSGFRYIWGQFILYCTELRLHVLLAFNWVWLMFFLVWFCFIRSKPKEWFETRTDMMRRRQTYKQVRRAVRWCADRWVFISFNCVLTYSVTSH